MQNLLARASDYGPSSAPGRAARYAQVDLPDRPARRPRGDPRGQRAARTAGPPHRRPRPARRSHLVTIWSWLRLTAALWLLRKLQSVRLADRRRRRGRRLAAHHCRRDRLPGRVAARLAAGPAVARRRLGAAHDCRLRDRPGDKAARLAGCGAGPRAGLRERVAAAGRRGNPARRAARRPGRGPGRAGYRGAVVGVADLRHHHRPGRAHRLRTDRVRHPAMAPPSKSRTRPGRRARHRPPADPGVAWL